MKKNTKKAIKAKKKVKASKKTISVEKSTKYRKKIVKKINELNEKCKKTGKPITIVIVHNNKTKSIFLIKSVKIDLAKRTGNTISFNPINEKGKETKEVVKKISYIKKIKKQKPENKKLAKKKIVKTIKK